MEKDKSLFVEFFGDYPIIRVLDFLIENDVFDYSKKDISRDANVSWNTLDSFWNQLEEREIVIHTRRVGKAEMYKLNTNNPLVKKLMELDIQLMKKSMQKIGEKKEKAKVFA